MRSKEAGSYMKKLLTLLLLSPFAFAEEDLPPVLYCAIGASQAEFHFNDNGEHWFRFTHIDTTRSKGLLKKHVIKTLQLTDDEIFFKQRAGLAGQIFFSINRKTGGIYGRGGSGECFLKEPLEQRKF